MSENFPITIHHNPKCGTAELGLALPRAGDAEILAAMIADPILVNRPIVTTPTGAILARPSERVFDVLERAPEEPS